MKLFIGWVATAGVLVTTAAEAQVLTPYRLDGPAMVPMSDVGGPYAALPPGYGPSRYGPPRYALSVLPPREIFAIAREMGFQPLGVPQQRGLVYTLSAINIDGEDGRLVVDARSGRIMRFMPAWRMRDRMGEETASIYGPTGPMPELPQYRRAPQSPSAAPRVASRTAVPLPKKSPPRAVATPAKPVAPSVPVAVTPPAPAATPVEQQAVVAPKPDEVRVIPMTPAPPPAVAPETPAAAAPTVAAPPVEAKPETPAVAAPAAPPVQGVE
ncbi:hypothetical protein [Tardiphaga sp.]|uniref:hypothetical protein n=1 Tax=Tardiphaga sp. TaxID=1926292 RepID=UPI002613C3FE|nr:hypothetical protein [Tardiphaga sp.]MDB5615932.1 hypothetical protein [Tardiphaga sp.]